MISARILSQASFFSFRSFRMTMSSGNSNVVFSFPVISAFFKDFLTNFGVGIVVFFSFRLFQLCHYIPAGFSRTISRTVPGVTKKSPFSR